LIDPAMNTPAVLGITMGDPAGIGPELCLRALVEPSVLDCCVPVIFGDAGVLRRVAQGGLPRLNCRVMSLADWGGVSTIEEPAVVDCGALDAAVVQPGQVAAECGRAGFTYIKTAIEAALAQRIAGVVTAPIHKEALQLSGVSHPGHTEIFTALTGARRSCMMLRSGVLTVSMVTTHVGYGEVPGLLTVRRVLDVMELTAEAMQRMLRRLPRLGVCGLNPHAGEHGLFGQREEERFVQPAIEAARSRGLLVEGPLPPDAAFTTGQRNRFDAIICLYHDQGHIPFKMLAFDTGVNVTLGLPIIRTSVDHGTAFDIAWRGVADPQSLYAAIKVALELAGERETAAIS
jgi:4-phospho-D-threonate 3-dehydrogenase / 4-phospho-D-erythronate 3-dehydrogenase